MTFCWYFDNLQIKFLPCFRFYSSFLILTDVWLTVFALVSFFNLGQFKQICYQFFQHYFNLLIFFLIFLDSSRFLTICCRFLSISFDFVGLVSFVKISFVRRDESDESFCQTCWVGQTILSDLIGLTKYFVRLNILSDFKNLD